MPDTHKSAGIRAAMEGVGTSLLYLPPCSPEFDPIENIFTKLKAMLRKAAELTVDGLWNTIGRIIDTFTPAECVNYSAIAGYDANLLEHALTGQTDAVAKPTLRP
jgi:transposase